MELVKISKYLPDTVRQPKHQAAQRMKALVEALVTDAGGQLSGFEIIERGTALLTIPMEKARLAVVAEFSKQDGVTVTGVSAVAYDMEKNRRVQQRADRLRAIRKPKNG